MSVSGFLLYRLNLVDRQDLFTLRPVQGDSDLVEIFQFAANERFDVAKQGSRSGYKWALRNVIYDSLDTERPFLSAIFSCEIASRRGYIITPDGVTEGTSRFNPPTATLACILVDLKRHIIAVEEVPRIMQGHTGWLSHLQTILATAAWHLKFTSVFRLDPVLPSEALETRLRSLERLTRLRVTLSIPNPDLEPEFQRLFDEMEKGGVRELTQDMRNERGLSTEKDTLPRQAIEMAMKGYRRGKIRLYGYKDGRKEDFTIGNDVTRVEVQDIRDFIDGYMAGRPNPEVKRFARAIIKRIDEATGRQGGHQHDKRKDNQGLRH